MAKKPTEHLEPVYDVEISDHAVLRYLERVHGMNIDAIRQKVVPSSLVRFVAMGATKVKAPNHGLVLICDRGRVVTIYSSEDERDD